MNAEDVLASLAHGLADLVLVVDEAGVVRWAGGDAARTIGGAAAAFTGRPASDILDGSDGARHWLGPAAITNPQLDGSRQAVLACEDGSRRDCEIRVRLVKGGWRTVSVRLLSHHAQEPQAGKPRLIGPRTIHDLNNLLGIVLGFTDVLLAAEPGASERRSDLQEIHAAASATIERLRSG